MHTRLNSIETHDNCLYLDGRPIVDYLTNDYAHYLYSARQIRERIAMLRNTLPCDIKLHYAVKANPMPEVVALIAPLVDGLDVASGQELSQTHAQAPSQSISFAGPAKQPWELAAAIDAGVVINIESATELDRIVQIASSTDQTARVAIRVNPSFELKQSGMQMAGGAKPFGIDAEAIADLYPQLRQDCICLEGLHIFAGSQNLQAQALIEAHTHTFKLAQAIIDELQQQQLAAQLRHVNIGGGFGIPYFDKQVALNINEVCEGLAQRLAEREGLFSQLNIVMELGRYIVGEAGYYVCQITDVKHSRGIDYLMVNGGMHHHLANSGNFGQVIRKNYPVLLAESIQHSKPQLYDIAGPLCTPLDIVAAKISLPPARIGQHIVVLQSGAYGYSASPLRFLSHPEPVQRLIESS